MLNARKILKNVNKMTQQERIGLHSGRKMWLLDVAVDDYFGNIPREVMFTCIRMYIEQQCKNGYKSFPLCLHDLYSSAGQGTQHRIGKTIDAMTAKKVYQIDDYAVIRLLRDKPKNVVIDVEALINDLDDIYNLDEQRELDYGETVIDRWTWIIACGIKAVLPESELQAEGEFTGYEERTVSYAAARALERADGMHYIEGEKVNNGMIKIAVDTRFLNSEFSGNYEEITAPYADCKAWNNSNPPELQIVFSSYDSETGLCKAKKPIECNITTDEKYNAAYSYKRQQRQRGSRDIIPPVINIDDLNVEVPECLLN